MRNYRDLQVWSKAHLLTLELLCRDLAFFKDDDFQRFAKNLTEIRKTLTSFLSSVEEQIDLKNKAVAKA